MRIRLTYLLCVVLVAGGCAGRRVVPVAAVPATSIATATDHFARLGQVTLRYREVGAGAPVILIHGYSNRLEVWSGLGDSLARDHRVIALDLRGFGESTKFNRPEDFGAKMADDIIGLLDALRIGRAHIVGHSMGAVVAANVAARYPRRTASVMLIAGPFYGDSVAFARETARWGTELQAGRGLTALVLWLFPGMDSATALGINADALAHNDLGSLIAVLPSLGALAGPLHRPPPAPALIAVGGVDPVGPYSRDLATQWPTARLLEVPTANHITILSQPELLLAMRQLTH